VAHHVSKQRFGQLVEEALSGLPEPFASHLEEVPVEIRPRPTRRDLQAVGLEDDELLLGLYQGHPLTQRSVNDDGTLPAVIYIFQEDVELVSDSEEELVRQVRITVLHEVGHHFGMSEEDLDKLGYR
jgi:predicted Zn-dependent protease with MMP-like domain